MKLSTTTIQAYQEALLAWYEGHKRDLPWRSTQDPYLVFVSEIMLQQTQVERVLPKFQEFIGMYPTIRDLAAAHNADLLRVWQGMGYNSRVLRMRSFAQAVVEQYNCVIPRERELLLKLPGIGPYTSGAIACFGYGRDVAFIDTNIKRILHRVFEGLEFQGWQLTDKQLVELSEKVYPQGQAYPYHQALMDVGSSVCKAAKLYCQLCPLRDVCVTSTAVLKNPALLLERKSYKKSTVPFKESKRFIRGGVVEYLRIEHQKTLVELRNYVQEKLRPMKKGELEGVLKDLVAEGLVQQSGGNYFL